MKKDTNLIRHRKCVVQRIENVVMLCFMFACVFGGGWLIGEILNYLEGIA